MTHLPHRHHKEHTMSRNTTDTLATIRAAVTEREWSPRELERQAGITYRAAWTLLRGKHPTSVGWDTLDRVLAALGLHVVKGP